MLLHIPSPHADRLTAPGRRAFPKNKQGKVTEMEVNEQPKVTIRAVKYCADGRVVDYGVVTGGSMFDRIKNKIIAITGRRE